MQTTFNSSLRFLSVLLALGVLSVLVPKTAHATHIVGGDISYRCLGNNKYEITLDVYRDCFYGDPAAWFDSPASVGFFNDDDVLVKEEKFAFSGMSDTLNNFFNDECLFIPGDVCVHVTTYKKTVTLPFIEGGYNIVYQRCCRNQLVVNIEDPLQTGATYCVHLTEEAMQECNSSPQFGAYAPLLICVNKLFTYDHSATDIDGDSLVYRLVTPLTGGTFSDPQPIPPSNPPYDTVTWVSPFYSQQNMLGGDSIPFQINPSTGVITAYPEILGQFVIGIAVDEYRDGQFISQVRRDYQVNVVDCGEFISSFFAPEAQCEENTVSFNNQSQLANDYLWYFDWGGDLSLTSTEESPTFTFPDTGTYTVALIAEPSSVCADTSYREIFLQDNSLFVEYELDVFDCVDSSVVQLFDMSFDTITMPVSWYWELTHADTILATSTEQNPVLIIPNVGIVEVSLTVLSENGCERTAIKTFETGQDLPGNYFIDTLYICEGEEVALNPNVDSIGPYPYWWSPPSAFVDNTEPNPVVSPTVTTTYNAIVYAADSLCFLEKDVTVDVTPLPELAFDFFLECDGITVDFFNESQGATAFVWNFGDPTDPLAGSNEFEPIYTYPDTGTYMVMLATDTSEFCQDTIFEEIFIPVRDLQAAFTYDLADCETDFVTIAFTDQSFASLNNIVSWEWTFSDGQTSTEQNPTITVTTDIDLEVTLTVSDPDDCATSTTEIIPIELTTENVIDSVQICLGESVALNPGGDPDLTYEWTPSTGLSDANAANPIATPTVPTTYSVTITNPNALGCVIEREAIVFVPPAIDLTVSSDVANCDPQTLLTASATQPVDFVWENSMGDIVSTESFVVVPISGIETYTVTATDAFGCEETETVSVQGGPVNIEVTPDQIICSDEPLIVSVTNLDPSDILTYNWTAEPPGIILGGANTSTPILATDPGEYTLTVEVSNQFGCEATEQVNVIIVDADIDLSFTSLIQCNGATVEFTNTSTNGAYYVWDFGVPGIDSDTSTLVNPTYTYTEVGVYTVTLSILYDDLDCVDEFTMDVDIMDPEIIADFSYDFELCAEDSITIQFFDESFSFLNNINFWLWEFSTGDTSNEQNPSLTVYGDQQLTVTLNINTTNNCPTSVTKTISIDITDVNIADTLVLCLGDTTELNPNFNANYNYNWTPSTGLSDPTASNPLAFPTETTTYTVAIENFTGDTCTILHEVTVFVPEEIQIEADTGVVSCVEPVTLTVSGNIPLDYTWTTLGGDPVGTGPSVTVDPGVSTSYLVTAEDEYGCTAIDTASVFVPDAIDLDVIDDFVSCNEPNTLTVNSSISPIDYEWFEGGQSIGTGDQITVDPDETTTYTVVATDQYNCQNSDTVEVTVPEPIDIDVDQEVISCQSPVTLNATGNVPLSWEWYTNNVLISDSSSVTVDPGTTTYIQVVGTDTFNCTATDSVLVTVPPTIDLMLEQEVIACDDSVSIFVSGNVPLDYTWFNGNGDPIGTGPSVTVLPDSLEYYYVIAVDTFDCTAGDSTLVINGIVDVSTDGTVITCPTDSMMLFVYNDDPFDDLNYTWTAGPGGTIISQSPNGDTAVISSIPGSVDFIVEATNQFGCTALDTTVVIMSDFDPVAADTVRACPGIGTPIYPGGNVNYVYEWSPAIGLDDINSPNPIATLDTSQTYTVTITDFDGVDTCSAVLEVVVMVNPPIELEAFGDTTLCEAVTVDVSAITGQPATLEWFDDPSLTDPIGSGPTIPVTPEGAVTYYVVATDDLMCLDTAEVTINSFPLDFSAQPIYDLCLGDAIEIEVVNNAPDQDLQHFWTPVQFILEGALTESPLVNPTESMFFTDSIVNQYGCTDTISVFVNVIDVETSLFATADPDTIIFNSGQVSQLLTLNDPSYNYLWEPSISLDDPFVFDPIASPDETTTYTVTIVGDNECSSSRSVTVVVINPQCIDPFVFVPTGFSPNGDGNNDILYVRGPHIDELYFAVYNRWGQKVFDTTDKDVGWDGTFKGEVLPPDVYGFYLQARCFNGEEYFKKGNITLLR
jgi:gliding motility-associated-like protein